MRDLVIIGAGGHGRETLDIVHAENAAEPTWNFLGFVADDPDVDNRVQRLGTTIIGGIDTLAGRPDLSYVLAIGNCQLRATLDQQLTAAGLTAATLIHPQATVGSDNRLGAGTILAAGARITSNVTTGRHVHLNANAIISHDSVVGDHSSLSPAVTLTGSTTVGHRVFLGAGVTTIPGRTIGDDATVGAGAVVVTDIPASVTAMGVPARWSQP